jgi:hypothetical protein
MRKVRSESASLETFRLVANPHGLLPRSQYFASRSVSTMAIGSLVAAPSSVASRSSWPSSFRARPSPAAALFVCCCIATSSLVIVLLLPRSVTFTGAERAFRRVVATFKVPLGRPRGLPDLPFLKRVCLGGRLKPTEWDSLSLSTTLGTPFSSYLCEAFASRGMSCVFPSEILPTSNYDVDIGRVDLNSAATPACAFSGE